MLKKPRLLVNYLRLFPLVKAELNNWWIKTKELPDALKIQAQDSIRHKAFHCLGGSVFALYPGADTEALIKAIVSLQTISDYLDNLCDRMDVSDGSAFQQLHLSFTDALTPGKQPSPYYDCYPYSESSYLTELVTTCQSALACLPHYEKCQGRALELANYYCNLQVLKHLKESSDKEVADWITQTFGGGLHWNEWAAATGSTLGIFLLMAMACRPCSPEQVERACESYFPWVQSLHILLDYLIDRHEDTIHDDLNFTFYYSSLEECSQRLGYIYAESRKRVSKLPHSHFHQLVLQGLLSMYGSDPKVKEQRLSRTLRPLLQPLETRALHNLCLLLRNQGYLA